MRIIANENVASTVIRERRDNVLADSLNPAQFFERTFLTGSLPGLASQLAEHDAKGIAPARDVLGELPGTEPALILSDEPMNYISRTRQLERRDRFFTGIQSFYEEAYARIDVVVCVSILASERE